MHRLWSKSPGLRYRLQGTATGHTRPRLPNRLHMCTQEDVSTWVRRETKGKPVGRRLMKAGAGAPGRAVPRATSRARQTRHALEQIDGRASRAQVPSAAPRKRAERSAQAARARRARGQHRRARFVRARACRWSPPGRWPQRLRDTPRQSPHFLPPARAHLARAAGPATLPVASPMQLARCTPNPRKRNSSASNFVTANLRPLVSRLPSAMAAPAGPGFGSFNSGWQRQSTRSRAALSSRRRTDAGSASGAGPNPLISSIPRACAQAMSRT